MVDIALSSVHVTPASAENVSLMHKSPWVRVFAVVVSVDIFVVAVACLLGVHRVRLNVLNELALVAKPVSHKASTTFSQFQSAIRVVHFLLETEIP